MQALNSMTCPRCQSERLRWRTLRRGVHVDVLACDDCSAVIAEEDWMAPLMPLLPGRCMNCGARREQGVCSNCNLHRDEDLQVHDELRMHIDPELDLLHASRRASQSGRRLIALKLATACAATEEPPAGETARGLRVWLLSALGESKWALQDAQAWVEYSMEPSAMAYASYGQQLQHNAFPGAAADAYQKAIRLDPSQVRIRAARTSLLLDMGRNGQAMDEVCALFERDCDPKTMETVVSVAEKLCNKFEQERRDDAVARVLQFARNNTLRSAVLLGHRARLSALNGDRRQAKQDLKQAQSLVPELELYERVREVLRNSASSSWFGW